MSSGAEAGGPGHVRAGGGQVAPVDGRLGRPGVDEGARPVGVEVAVAHQRQRPLGERRGRRPVALGGGDDAALGQDDGGQRWRAGLVGGVEGVGQDRVGPVEVALQQVGNAPGVHHGRPVGAGGAEAVQGELRVAAHGGHAVTAEERPEVGHVARHGAAVGQPAGGRGRPLGRRRPALGLGRPAEQGEDERAVHGDRRVPLDQAALLEPLHPAQHRVHAAARPDRLHHLQDQPRDQVGVAGGLGVVDGQLGQVVGLAPGGRADVERPGLPGLTALQLGPEQLPEQVVVAVPAVVPVQRHQQEVRPLQRLQHPARPAGVQDGVAQRPAQAVQYRRAGEERHQLRGEPGQQLLAEVVGHEAVVAGEGEPGVGLGAARLQGQRRQVQPDRPPLGAADQLGHLRPGRGDPGPLQQGTGLEPVHGQLAGPELQHPVLGGLQGRRQRRPEPGGQRQPRARREVQGDLGDLVQAPPVGEQLDVVQDQADGVAHGRGQPGPRAGGAR